MKLMSLFDGSGGFPLAASLCGIEPVYASEVEPYPIAVTKSRFPNMKHLGDVSRIKGAEIEPVDIITFGSPCQDMSVAGKRAGLKHTAVGDEETTRSGLFMEAIRIIKEMRVKTNGIYPRFAVWENVPGAFSSNRGEDFRLVLEEFIKITEPNAVMPAVPQAGWAYADCISGYGWSIAYRVFDAQYWGVPQRRRRIYLVADFRGECAQEILFKRESLRGYFEAGRMPWQGIAADAQNCVGTDDCIPINTMLANRHKQLGRGTGFGIGEPGDKQFTISAAHCHAVCIPVLDDRAGESELVLDDQGGQQISVRTDGKSPTLRAEAHGNVPCIINKKTLVYDTKFIQEDIEATLKASGGTYGGGSENLVAEQSFSPIRYIVRRLTPTECARLQGFPDWWGEIPKKDNFTDDEYVFWLNARNTYAKINNKTTKEYSKEQMLSWYNKLHSDSSEYKMWGNGIALPNALYVMQGIAEVVGVHHSK